MDLALTKSVNPALALPGDTITYTLTFTNSGLVRAETVLITDILPVEIINESYQAVGVSVIPIGGSNFRWQVNNLGAGQRGVIIVTGQLAAVPPGVTIPNTAEIRGGEAVVISAVCCHVRVVSGAVGGVERFV